MNALPIWDDESHLEVAPVLDALPEPAPPSPFAGLPADPRRLAVLDALAALPEDATPEEAVLAILTAADTADTAAGIARVDTHDVVLQQRIARIILGANAPSRGPATRAREVLRILGTAGAA